MSHRSEIAEVTVIGLDRMGAALTRALRSGGRSVAVWNRDASKADALRDGGANVCATFADITEHAVESGHGDEEITALFENAATS